MHVRLLVGLLALAGCNACNEPAPRPPTGPAVTPTATAWTSPTQPTATTTAGQPPVTTAATAPSLAAAPPGRYWVVGYYGGYQSELLSVSAIDFAAMSHVAVSRVVPRTDGSLDTSFDHKSGLTLSQGIVNAAHANGRRAILMVGGDGAHDGFVGAVTTDQARLVDGLARVVKSQGYDGIDIDWEPVPAADEPLIEGLLDALRRTLPTTTITMPVAWDKIPRNAARLAARLDQMNIMTYGMTGAWSGWRTWHSSALYGRLSSVDKSVNAYLAAGVPPRKLGVGVGFYGTCWAGATGPDQDIVEGFRVVTSDNDMSYTNIVSLYAPHGRALWDDAVKAPFLSFPRPTGPKGCTYVTYEDERSIAEKAAYIKRRGLGGVVVWTINQGVVGGQQPLAAALRKGLLQ